MKPYKIAGLVAVIAFILTLGVGLYRQGTAWQTIPISSPEPPPNEIILEIEGYATVEFALDQVWLAIGESRSAYRTVYAVNPGSEVSRDRVIGLLYHYAEWWEYADQGQRCGFYWPDLYFLEGEFIVEVESTTSNDMFLQKCSDKLGAQLKDQFAKTYVVEAESSVEGVVIVRASRQEYLPEVRFHVP